MNFDEQSIEMKRTLLEASVGRVTISAHALELDLLLILCVRLTSAGEEFEREYDKPRTLGRLINEIEPLNLFSQDEHDILDLAKKKRNKFTHQLSDEYTASISSGASMYQLIQEFEKIKSSIDDATNIARKKLDEMAKQGGVDVHEINETARNNIDKWENA